LFIVHLAIAFFTLCCLGLSCGKCRGGDRECYFASARTENKGLLALLFVRQGRWVDLLLDLLGLSVASTPVPLKLLTGIHGKGYRLH